MARSSYWMDPIFGEPSRPFEFQHSYRETDGEMSQFSYAALNDELHRNEHQLYRTTSMIDSVHTEFQEHEEEVLEADEILRPNEIPEFDGSRTPTQLIYEGVDEYDPPPPPRDSYMGRTSPFSLDHADQHNGESCSSDGNATLSFPGKDGEEIVSISKVNLALIEERSALLAAAFENAQSGPQLYLEILTPESANPFLAFLYTGSYALVSDRHGDVPTSLLSHSQLYRLAVVYELPELKTQAYVNVLRQCEFGCSSADKPIDLCAAIRYCYQHLVEHENLIDAILHYCVSCFLSHRLAEDATFRQLAFEVRPFHQALCRNVMNRGFEDEAAMAIIQMPFEPHVPPTYASREDKDFRYAAGKMAGDLDQYKDAESSSSKRKRTEPISNAESFRKQARKSVDTGPPAGAVSNLTLALRPQIALSPQISLRSQLSPRSRRKLDQAISDQSESEGEESKTAGDQKTSGIMKASSSAQASGLSLASVSDDDFEMVQALVEALNSDDGSDTDTIVEVERTAPSADNGARALPIRPHTDTANAANAALEQNDAASDSEWDIV